MFVKYVWPEKSVTVEVNGNKYLFDESTGYEQDITIPDDLYDIMSEDYYQPSIKLSSDPTPKHPWYRAGIKRLNDDYPM